MIGTSDIIKWPRKISFQTNFTLEQRLLLLHLTSLEVQKNKTSHRNRIDVCNIFCVCLFTYVRFQPPIPHLGNRICHFCNFSLDFWIFSPNCGCHKWMNVKPKVFLFTNESFWKFWSMFFLDNSSNKQRVFGYQTKSYSWLFVINKLKNHYQRVKIVLGKFYLFGKKSKGTSLRFHNYTLVVWIKLRLKCELSIATEISMEVLLGAIKLVMNCL